MKKYGRYSQAYKKAAVSTVDQRKLILMLYDGAIKFLTLAMDKMDKGDRYESHQNMIRGKSIIAELLASLNLEQGGEIAQNLQRLYTYMFNELIEANLHQDRERIVQVLALLRDLRQGWDTMKSQEAPQEQPRAAADAQQRTKSINVHG